MKLEKHIPVLLKESIKSLNIKNNGFYIDGTFGQGNHSKLILSKLGNYGKLYAIDCDYKSIKIASSIKNNKIKIIHGSFSNIEKYMKKHNMLGKINGILLDLGISNLQLNNYKRGFSFMKDELLDMRMDNTNGIPLYKILNKININELSLILKKYGEEKFCYRIAKKIIIYRKKKKIRTTFDLLKIISKAIPIKNKFKHYATKSFQALRIFINNELNNIKKLLKSSLSVLSKNGRLSIISFNSLEDRIIKKFMKKYSSKINIPQGLPISEKKIKEINFTKLKILKKIIPSHNEIINNIKSRSAILRIAEKIN
ncbi:Ribosomal RNA small subunit methyltransferase H [Candidatus Annandia adelgestsuga]|uniref:Ribosomal RNA small subunit methyltransferase H n=1 Tax=Candidatus Annandia adelgestsuga TaxID=1302411 RepID=A0A3Q9CP06_9ENTR|nr:16S rRNA (cytosine(1402)-N(4))-methyltransferase RsmH [Candidatus Annandia adelgestsuga]AZP36175.1 Ribosomal RNA small subunit methyltransferase H [Candidatus Annandia adelgestsuga]